VGQPANQEDIPRTRCGYTPSESIRAFDKALLETGAVATGRSIHFAADVIASGGIDSFLRSAWEYAICHIGLASPRIFIYLKRRTKELQDILNKYPDEAAYGMEEFQVRAGEIVLVMRDAPTKTITGWPRVGAETHAETWIRSIQGGATETAALRKVWRPEGDSSVLRTIGAEICKSISEGALEKTLFWIKWLFEEEAALRKRKGGGLTTYDRSIPGSKNKGGVGFFLLALFTEIYKECAAKGTLRMDEEFQTLVDIWKSDKDIPLSAKKQILTILVQILCEVPKWKVPAAPALIKDPVAMSVAIRQVPKFFREVLAYDPPKAVAALTKAFRSRGKVDPKAVLKAKKGEAAEDQMSAFDRALDAYFSRT
jgi:hypothetical protein